MARWSVLTLFLSETTRSRFCKLLYNDMVYELFPDLPDVEAESSDALVPVVRSPSPKEKRDPPSRSDGDLLSEAVEAFRCQVTNTTNKLHAEHGPD
jgi:hypothetical protein